MSDRAEQARAEAERQIHVYGDDFKARTLRANLNDAFVQGVEWADANPQPHTITTSEAEAAQDHIGRLCTKEDRWTMSVPPRDDDSDILLMRVAQDAEAAVEALARVRELHREVIVWELDSANGTWVYEGEERRVLTRLCAECSSDEVTDAVEDAEFTAGWYPGEVTWPCATYQATEVNA